MKHTKTSRRGLLMTVVLLTIMLSILVGCAPTPDTTQIESAIRISLAAEKEPPALVFEDMQVPKRFSGKADAVLWAEDKTIQRNYSLTYDKKQHAFQVSDYTTSRREADGSYSLTADDLSLTLTEYAGWLDKPGNPNRAENLFFVGQGSDLAELRAQFEAEKLSFLSTEQLAEVEECDLGGDTLLLFIPRFEGVSVWLCQTIYTHGDHIEQGEELARFEGKPVYILCDFDDKMPKHEIHVSFNGRNYFFRTFDSLLNDLKTN